MEISKFQTFYCKFHQQKLPSFTSLKPFTHQIHHFKCFVKPCKSIKRKPFTITISSSSNSNSNSNSNSHSHLNSNDNGVSEIWADSDFVEVIGIGNRLDSLFDFCQTSTCSSNSLRFWNVIKSESLRGRLHQRILEKDNAPNIVDAPSNSVSHSKTVLVASAGYGDEYILASEILRTIKSSSGIVVAIVLKPFSFEGQRRQNEVKMLVDKLQDCVNFWIDIDIDTLLKMDMVTLDEALKTAYRAVSTAITAVSILVSDSHQKYNHSTVSSTTQVTVDEVKKVLNSYKEGRVGFGVGQNVEASIVQAVYDCPFLSMGLKDLDGVVLCVLTSSSPIDDNEVRNVLRTFREATECTKEVILSIAQNPVMKPNVISSTVIIAGNIEGKPLQKSSILSRLVDSIPFVFNFLRRNDVESDTSTRENSLRENIFPPILSTFMDNDEELDMIGPAENNTENMETYSDKNIAMDDNFDEKDAAGDSFKYIEPDFQGAVDTGKKSFVNRNIGTRYRVDQEWQEEDLNATESDNPRIFQLPVGVKLSDQIQGNSFNGTYSRQSADKTAAEDITVTSSSAPSFEAVSDIWSTASTLLKGRNLDVPKKQGLLSSRAASMLEAERDSKTKWSPVTKIQYRGGIYKGRCQGGLPEGRGRLTFQDGSVYDGMWRLGKRSGLGSLFFSNGDVFHGSWRDDLMHGKGWLYFHSGERWFVNFWKGRANGEGRFYSKSGEVLFGQFRDGWRDGRFLCVKVDGRRYAEVWNEGVMTSCEELES